MLYLQVMLKGAPQELPASPDLRAVPALLVPQAQPARRVPMVITAPQALQVSAPQELQEHKALREITALQAPPVRQVMPVLPEQTVLQEIQARQVLREIQESMVRLVRRARQEIMERPAPQAQGLQALPDLRVSQVQVSQALQVLRE
jgi:hypothetical protein